MVNWIEHLSNHQQVSEGPWNNLLQCVTIYFISKELLPLLPWLHNSVREIIFVSFVGLLNGEQAIIQVSFGENF